MTFRRRVIVAMVPLFALLVALGGTGTILIYHLGNRIDEILRENYDSVVYMRDLNEALERIDSSFQFALAGREKESHEQYKANWRLYDAALSKEQHNITLPGEGELADKLTTVSTIIGVKEKISSNARANKGTISTLASRIRRGSTADSARSKPYRARFCGSTRTTWKRPIGRHVRWLAPP